MSVHAYLHTVYMSKNATYSESEWIVKLTNAYSKELQQVYKNVYAWTPLLCITLIKVFFGVTS